MSFKRYAKRKSVTQKTIEFQRKRERGTEKCSTYILYRAALKNTLLIIDFTLYSFLFLSLFLFFFFQWLSFKDGSPLEIHLRLPEQRVFVLFGLWLCRVSFSKSPNGYKGSTNERRITCFNLQRVQIVRVNCVYNVILHLIGGIGLFTQWERVKNVSDGVFVTRAILS